MDKRILLLAGIVFFLCAGIFSEISPDLFQVRPLEYTVAHLPQVPAISVPNFEKVVYASAPALTEDTESVSAPVSQYLEITEGCGPYFEGECVHVRSGPSTASSSVLKVRTGIVLKIAETLEHEGRLWHRVYFDEWIRYPERVSKQWYVEDDFVRVFSDRGIEERTPGAPIATSTKRIEIDRGDQMLYAYEGDVLFMEESISTGREFTPTPRGAFTIYKKTPTRYMQGPLPGISDQYYDLPGVPWVLYFTNQGGAIHGAYWHDNFGKQWSHGCVNLPLDTAQKIYYWADIGTTVLVRD